MVVSYFVVYVPADALSGVCADREGPGGHRGHLHYCVRQTRGKVFGIRGSRDGKRDGPKQRVRRQGGGQSVPFGELSICFSCCSVLMYQVQVPGLFYFLSDFYCGAMIFFFAGALPMCFFVRGARGERGARGAWDKKYCIGTLFLSRRSSNGEARGSRSISIGLPVGHKAFLLSRLRKIYCLSWCITLPEFALAFHSRLTMCRLVKGLCCRAGETLTSVLRVVC